MVMRKAFTLIELLIVVAIIAILAAIAVPNFLEAQVRAKVSRVKNDLRTNALAVETYTVDHNNAPPRGTYNRTGNQITAINTFALWLDPIWVTTPIAYMTGSSSLMDPFQAHSFDGTRGKSHENFVDGWYRYTATKQDNITEANMNTLRRRYGNWRMLGAGPDKWVFNLTFNRPANGAPAIMIYDPTNGTVSIGDVGRTQKEPELTLGSVPLPAT